MYQTDQYILDKLHITLDEVLILHDALRIQQRVICRLKPQCIRKQYSITQNINVIQSLEVYQITL